MCGYCTYNKSSQNKQYCKDGECGSVCDDDSDCSAYGSSTPYCIGGVCKSCGSSGDIVSSGTKCCSGLYRTSSGICGSCGVYSYDGSRNCYTSCSVGSTHCASGYYCKSNSCVSSCGNYLYDSSRNCYTSCTVGSTHCKSGYYCKSSSCVSSCGKTSTGFTIGYLSNRTCCSSSKPAVSSNTCYECTGTSQSACATGEVCSGNVCEEDTPDVCTTTSSIPNSDWLGNAVKCSGCGSSQVQARGSNISGYSCHYPYVSSTTCYRIPSSGSSTSWSGRGTVRHRTASITCKGRRETWHLIGPYVSWWEAVEVCERLGLHMPPTRTSLTSTSSSTGCNGSARWSLLNSAFSISGSTNVWTEEDNGDNCSARGVSLYSGNTDYTSRSNYYVSTSYRSRFALCGPAI